MWNYNPAQKPFIVEFLYTYSFPSPKVNLQQLIEEGLIKDINSTPRGFEPISNENFTKILKLTRTGENFIID